MLLLKQSSRQQVSSQSQSLSYFAVLHTECFELIKCMKCINTNATVDKETSEEWVIVNFLMLYSSLFSTIQIQYFLLCYWLYIQLYLVTEFCNNPLPLSNGRVSVVATRTGQVAEYSCNDGYVLQGVSSRECSANGKWKNSTPSCESV